jgi:hypothetical protein
MTTQPADPTITLEQKLKDLASRLPEDELVVFQAVLARAASTENEVAGFTFHVPTNLTPDPCEGGEVSSRTFGMLHNVLQGITFKPYTP